MAKPNFITNPDGSRSFYTKGSAAVITVDANYTFIEDPNNSEHVTVIKEPTETNDLGNPWSPWGENDDFPNQLIAKNAKSGVLQTAISINAKAHFGAGIVWGKEVVEGKKIIFQPEIIPDWRGLVRNQQINRVLGEVDYSLEYFNIAFVEVVLTNDHKSIHNIQCLDTPYCRLEKRNKSTGKIENVYFSSDIGTAAANKNNTDKIPMYDSSDPHKYQKFVFVVFYRGFGRIYYPEPSYYSVYRNGWADVALQVPEFITAIYKNQSSIKYHVRITIEHLRTKYNCWENPPNCDKPEDVMKWQLDRIAETQAEIDKTLTDTKNAGKSILTIKDEQNNVGVEIEPIKSYLESSKELPNASAAISEMLFSSELDPAILGHGVPGGKDLSGSGSDKRIAFNLKQALLMRNRNVSIQIPNLVAIIHNYNEELFPVYKDIDINQTLDKNKSGSEAVINN